MEESVLTPILAHGPEERARGLNERMGSYKSTRLAPRDVDQAMASVPVRLPVRPRRMAMIIFTVDCDESDILPGMSSRHSS